MTGRQKEIERHLTPEELDETINEAEQADEARLVRRLNCIKNLYAGDTLGEAGWRVGVDESTVSRWTDAWNEAGVDGLRPNFGGGRPSRMTSDQRERLLIVLEDRQPWTTKEVKRLIEEAFDISYSERHVARLLDQFGMNYAKPRPQDPDRPEDADELLDDRLQEAIDELEEDDLITDGGCVIGFLDEAWPQPTENRQRLWAFGTPTVEKETPDDEFDDATVGFYALNGSSAVECYPDVSQERFVDFFEQIREQNPTGRILLICDNFSSHFAEKVDDIVDGLGIKRVALPTYSPHLNPIEPIWDSVKRDLSAIDIESTERLRALIHYTFRRWARRLSFADEWMNRFLDGETLRKLRP